MEPDNLFESFFDDRRLEFLFQTIDLALDEDGPDLAAEAIFNPEDRLKAKIITKEELVLAGLPIAPLILARMRVLESCQLEMTANDGQKLPAGAVIAHLNGPAVSLLRAERIILNFISHLSGIATLTSKYVAQLAGTKCRLLDTRKTLPGLRLPEKYAVRVGGGFNHRFSLGDMFMLKDNHIDHAGGITAATQKLRDYFKSDNPNISMPPLEIECRTLADVQEAASLNPERIMLDNMSLKNIKKSLEIISALPKSMETEVSGGINMDNIREVAMLGPDFISVGRLTHSAPASDISMLVEKESI